MTRYLPRLTTSPDGLLVEEYGPAHAQRQADASLAVSRLADPDAAIVLRVGVEGRDLVRVYETDDPDDDLRLVVWIRPERPITPSLHRINVEQERAGDDRITHLGIATYDPLYAPDDRNLEVPAHHGLVRVSRRKLLERVALGQRTANLAEVVGED